MWYLQFNSSNGTVKIAEQVSLYIGDITQKEKAEKLAQKLFIRKKITSQFTISNPELVWKEPLVLIAPSPAVLSA